MMVGRRALHLGPIEPAAAAAAATTTTTTTAAAAAATTPTTSALLKESRQLLLKQQLKLQLNINVSEMMDNLRRNVDVDEYNFSHKYDGDLSQNLARVHEVEEEAAAGAETRIAYEMATAAKDGQNKLDTVTTVPQLQQKFNKFNIEAATTSLCVAKVTTTTTAAAAATLSSSLAETTFTTTTKAYTSLSQKQPQNTALAKFNRIIDNTVPVISHYQQQQHQQQQQQPVAAATFSKTSQQQQQPQTSAVEMPMLSDSLKRRLASHHYYQTDLIVNNSKKIISSFDKTATAAATKGAHPTPPLLPPLTSTLISSQTKGAEPTTEEELKKRQQELQQQLQQEHLEDDQLKRNDVHYLLKQLNSFSDIEEIEIVDMKQKQRQQQQQLIRDKQQQHHHHQQQQQQLHFSAESQQNLKRLQTEQATAMAYDLQQQRLVATTLQQRVNETLRQVEYVSEGNLVTSQDNTTTHLHTDSATQLLAHQVPPDVSQHVASLPLYVSSYSQHVSGVTQQHVNTDHLHLATTTNQQHFVHYPPPQYADSVTKHTTQHFAADDDDATTTTKESKQHFQATATAASSPTATSLVIYSPSSQSHKGIRRYASLHQQDDNAEHCPHSHYHPHHHHLHQHPHAHCRYHSHHASQHGQHPLHPHLPHEHYSEGSILDSAAARAAACDPLALQQFVDDYIFQSCHYLETNNFAANYCTAMVESSSHEFRPSTTTTTRTSNEEYDDEECYVEDHSSAHSFELHECEPPTVICKAPAPAPLREQAPPQHIRASMRHLEPLSSPPPQYTMETRLCSSGVQTDLTASSLAQSFSLSSSLSSTEQRKRRQPIFKCCYTPLDRWREKRHQQQQQQQQQQQPHQLQLTKKRTKTVPTKRGEQQSSSSTVTTSCLKNPQAVAVVGAHAIAGLGASGGGVGLNLPPMGGGGGISITTAATTSSTSAIVVHAQQQHHSSLSTKNAPYAV